MRLPAPPCVVMACVLGGVLHLAGCPAAPPDPEDAGPADAGNDPPDAGPAPDYVARVESAADLAQLVDDTGSVKYLAATDAAAPVAPLPAACAFQNTAAFPFHIQFLRTQPGGDALTYDDYVARVLVRATRVWWGGQVHYSPGTVHPVTGTPGALLYGLYTDDTAADRLTVDDVRAVYARLAACAPAYADVLAFVPDSNEQRTTAAAARDALLAEGIAVILQ